MGGTRILSHVERTARLKGMVADYDNLGPSPEARAAIDQEYWRTVNASVENLVQQDLAKDIEIKREDQLVLSFGLVETERFKPRVEAAVAALAKRPQAEFSVNYLHDTILGAYRDALRLENLSRLRQKLQAIEKEIGDWPDAHLEFVKQRDRLVAEAMGGTPAEEQALRLYSELDERMEKFKYMERQNQNEGWRTAEERKDWQSTKQYMEQHTAAVNALIQPLTRQAGGIKVELDKVEAELARLQAESKVKGPNRIQAGKQAEEMQKTADGVRARYNRAIAADKLPGAAEAAVESVEHQVELRNEHRLVEAQILDEENTRHQITVGEVKGNLVNEVGTVRSLLRLAARYARVEESAMPLGADGVYVEREAVLQALSEIEAIDPQLFGNAGVKRFGRPSVLLVPGIGDGVYDTDRNRLVIPQRATKSALDSVAHAVVLYRLDMDAAYDNRKLFRSYKEGVKENAEVHSNLKLRKGLVRDYLLWVTREARGEAVLTAQTREWFEQRVAPNKQHPMLPREYHGLSLRQVHQKLEEVDRGQVTGEREYRVAVLNWMLEPTDETNLRDMVVPRIENALKLAPDNLAIVYSAAALLRQAQQQPRAAELFSRYAREATPGWWAKKAAELAAGPG
ncbi:MAG: hypothetical protein IT462_10880 [Planctomycetes bacterium]|nr:hypothetical protein [Planctomycetota bacterium]